MIKAGTHIFQWLISPRVMLKKKNHAKLNESQLAMLRFDRLQLFVINVKHK